MNMDKAIHDIEKALSCDLAPDYRKVLEASGGGVLDKQYRIGKKQIELRFLLGVKGKTRTILECVEWLKPWGHDRFLPVVEDMAQQFFCIGLTGSDKGKIFRTDGYMGHDDDKVSFHRVCDTFSEFWENLQPIPEPELDEFGRLLRLQRKDWEAAFPAGRNLDEVIIRNRTFIEAAAMEPNLPAVKWCLEKGASVRNALMDAFFVAFKPSWDVIEFLLDCGYGCDPQAMDTRRHIRIRSSLYDVTPEDRPRLEELMKQAHANYQKNGERNSPVA